MSTIRRANRATVLALFFVLIRLPAAGAAGTAPGSDDAQVTSLRALQAAARKPIDVRFERGFPRGVLARVPATGETPVDRAFGYLRQYRDLYRWTDPNVGLAVRRVADDRRIGLSSVVLFQTYKGIPVQGAEMVVHVQGNEILGTVGPLAHDLTLDVTPRIEARRAEDLARAAVGDAEAELGAATTLVVFDPSIVREATPDPRLAWVVLLDGASASRVFVDARTGEILARSGLDQDALHLHMKTAENESQAKTTACYFFSIDPYVGNESKIEPDYVSDPDAQNLKSFAHQTYDFYKATFNRNGYDGADETQDMFLHAALTDEDGKPFINARYMPYCDLWEFSTGMLSADVVGHEVAHGVISETSDLDHDAPAGALDEHYADTMAAFQTNDWMLGEGSPIGKIRFMKDPPSVGGQPDLYSQRKTDEKDGYERHWNANFMNKEIYLLADGDTHLGTKIHVNGVGRPLTQWLAYHTMTVLPSDADYKDDRLTANLVAVAANWSDYQLCSLRNAYAAIGIGWPDINCDGNADDPNGDVDGDFIADNVDNCPLAPNPDQADLDTDGIGDVCDPDLDSDGVPNNLDNCPKTANAAQEDVNKNGIGDACDPYFDPNDFDGDGVQNQSDDCPLVANPGQEDRDYDGKGDVCDPDVDGDGVDDEDDNCPTIPNPFQEDSDGDGIGYDCDKCPFDADTVLFYNVIYLPDGSTKVVVTQKDSDQDGIPDACDPEPGGGGTILLDGGLYHVNNGPKPDRKALSIDLSGAAGSRATIPLGLCTGRECVTPGGRHDAIQVKLTRLDPQIVAVVRDDRGRAVAHARGHRSTTQIRFEPRGGRSYKLVFELGPEFAGHTQFRLAESARTARPFTPPLPPASTPSTR